MADIVSRGTLFDPKLVQGLVDKVKGHSSIAALCAQTPIPFNGMKDYTFNMTDEVDLVAENGAKSRGGVSIAPRTITPYKVEFGFRTSSEFMTASEEYQFNIVSHFTDGFAKKVASGLDIMAFHGLNPRTAAASALIGDNHFDNGVTVITPQTGEDSNDLVERAIEGIQNKDYDPDGIALSPSFRSDLSKLTYNDGRKMFPELTWGKMAGALNGLTADCNKTVSFNNSLDRAIVGDFGNAFKWGYSMYIPTRIIEYGDPDNSGQDLQGHNQIYIRAEMYLGWAILDKNAFAVIRSAASAAADEDGE